MSQTAAPSVRITHIGGPTALVEIGRLRLLNDPTFDPAGTEYPLGSRVMKKTAAPALNASDIGTVDVVLLSHDQHLDNLDRAGRAYLSQAKQVLTTPSGAQRLGGSARGVETWETIELTGGDGLRVRISATPARHGPEEIRQAVGEVAGWIVEWENQGRGALYISGDTVLFEGVEEVTRRYRIGAALLHLGAARSVAFGPSHLTFTAQEGVQFAKMSGEAIIVPIHYEGWAHFSEGRAEIEQAFAAAGLEDRLRFLPLGQPVTIPL